MTPANIQNKAFVMEMVTSLTTLARAFVVKEDIAKIHAVDAACARIEQNVSDLCDKLADE